MIWMLACTAPEDPTALPVGADSDGPPSIQMDLPEHTQGQLEIRGEASDPDQPSRTLVVRLVSSLDGRLWRGNPDALGQWSWWGALTPGLHQIDAEVLDAYGRLAVASGEVQVGDLVSNLAPACAILTPADGEQFATGEEIVFEAEATDPEGGALAILWMIGDEAFDEQGFSLSLAAGTWEIELTVTDPGGQRCDAAVTISVDP